MKVAIIPARGGSKRIPGKNCRLFFGKPAIAWSIESAIESQCFDKVIVSTDDEKIASIARQYAAETPFIRPASLADDYTGTLPVIAHAIEYIQHDTPVEFACCIYPAAPFISSDDLQNSMQQLIQSDAEYCFSATEYNYPVQRAFRKTANGRCEMFDPQKFSCRSQDLLPAYHDAGQFYWGRTLAWLNQKPFFQHHSIPYVLPSYRVHDIDTEDDWKHAELLFKVLNENVS